MITGSWVGAAVLAAFFAALLKLASEYFKVRAIHFLFWLRLFALIVMLPVLWLVPHPQDPLYYVFAVSASVIFAYVDLYTFGMAARAGAGIVSRLQPLEVVGTFFIWLAITPSLAVSYAENPVRGLGILLSLGLGVFFALRLRRCEISWRTLRIMAVPIMCASLAVTLSKLAMDHAGNLHSGVFYYPVIQAATVLSVYIVSLNLPAISKRLPHFDFESAFFSKKVLVAGMVGGLIHLAALICKYYGISLAENPAYVTIVGLTAPLWILLIYRLVKRREEADILSSLGIVAAVLLLVIATKL